MKLRELGAHETARIVALLTVWKAAFFAFAAFARATFPGAFSARGYWTNFHFPPSAPPGTTIWLQTWDAQHYLYLAEYGYLSGEPSTAFFPGWPLAIRALAPIFGGHHLIAALVLANALSIAAIALLYHYVLRPRMSGDAAATAVCALIAFPGALFLQFPYSEALFLTLAVGAIAALERRHWALAGALAVALPVVRSVGAFIAVPMAYAIWCEYREHGRAAWRRVPWLLAPVAGVALYFAFMYLQTGDPTSGMRAQRAFISQRSLLSLLDIPGLLRSLADVELGHRFETSPIDRLAFAAYVAALVPLWRRHRLLFWYALPLGLVPALTSMMSFTRYLIVVFPVFVVAGELLAERPLSRRLTLGLLIAIQALLLLRHISFLWAG